MHRVRADLWVFVGVFSLRCETAAAAIFSFSQIYFTKERLSDCRWLAPASLCTCCGLYFQTCAGYSGGVEA